VVGLPNAWAACSVNPKSGKAIFVPGIFHDPGCDPLSNVENIDAIFALVCYNIVNVNKACSDAISIYIIFYIYFSGYS